MNNKESVLQKSVSGTKLVLFLFSAISFFFAFAMLFGIGMGLDSISDLVKAVILIITFIILSLPLFVVSYLFGRFSREKRFSSLSYGVYAFIGTLPLFLLLPNAFSSIDYEGMITMIILGLIYASVAYVGTLLGSKKNINIGREK